MLNIFDGYNLLYYINKDFFHKIKKKFGLDIKLLNENNKISKISIDKRYYLPIGLFSNNDFILKCEFIKTNRKFYVNMTNKNNIKSKITLTEIQKNIIDEINKNKSEIINKNKSPIYINLIAPCSTGKTIITIYLLLELKLKSFIITPSLELSKQWNNEIIKFSENVNIINSLNGVKKLLENKELIKNVDILIFPYKHLCNDEFNNLLIDNFSIGIIDEQHKYNLQTNIPLIKFFSKYTFPYFISLTATPRPINAFYLGKEINLKKITDLKEKKFNKIAYNMNIENDQYYQINYTKEYHNYKNFIKKNSINNFRKVLLNNINKKKCIRSDNNRIFYITKNIINTFLNNEINPKILVLTKFVNEINIYYENIINNLNNHENIFKIYANKNLQENENNLNILKDKIKSLEKYILIGTEDHLGTGIDIKDLNILHLTSVLSNKNKIIQYAGRISRDNLTKDHYFYFYNINSFDDINIDKEINTIINTLTEKNWNCFSKYIY